MNISERIALAVISHIAICFLMLLGFQETLAQTYYTTTEIGSFRTTGARYSSANSINSVGQVVGWANTESGAPSVFLWQNGNLSNLGASFPYSEGGMQANGINDSGVIVGNASFSQGSNGHAFLLENGVVTDLHPLIWQSGVFTNLGNPLGGSSKAFKINNSGVVVGEVYFNGVTQGFIYNAGVFTKIDCGSAAPGDGQFQGPAGINNLGVVASTCTRDTPPLLPAFAFTWNAGQTTNLGALNEIARAAFDINDAGQVVGGANLAYLFDHGVFHEMGRLVPVPAAFSQALAINNSGVAVGWAIGNSALSETHGFIYQNGIIKDINSLTPTNFQGYLLSCQDINDQGQIVCSGNRSQGVVLSPVQDTTAPSFETFDFDVYADAPNGSHVSYDFSAADDFDRNPVKTYSIPSGSLFPIGSSLVIGTARDASGNTTTSTFHVTVIDGPPTLSLPGDLVTNATGSDGATVNFIASATDNVSGDLLANCTPLSNTVFPIGTTTVNCSATDGAHNVSTGTFNIFVLSAGQTYMPPDSYGVTVQPSNGPSMTFEYVESSGITTVAPIDPASIGSTPAGFAVSSGNAFQLSTTAIFQGSVTLAFAIPGPISETDLNALSILHNDNGTLVDVTSGRDYNSATQSGTIYATTYSFSPFYLVKQADKQIVPLFNQSTAYQHGSNIPIRLKVANSNGVNISSATLALSARNVVRLGDSTNSGAISPGASNADNNFSYSSGDYKYNLKTTGLTPGRYALSFYVGSDHSVFYTVEFLLR